MCPLPGGVASKLSVRFERGRTDWRSHIFNCGQFLGPSAKETKTRGWWHAYGGVIPSGFDVYIGLCAWNGKRCLPGPWLRPSCTSYSTRQSCAARSVAG